MRCSTELDCSGPIPAKLPHAIGAESAHRAKQRASIVIGSSRWTWPPQWERGTLPSPRDRVRSSGGANELDGGGRRIRTSETVARHPAHEWASAFSLSATSPAPGVIRGNGKRGFTNQHCSSKARPPPSGLVTLATEALYANLWDATSPQKPEPPDPVAPVVGLS